MKTRRIKQISAKKDEENKKEISKLNVYKIVQLRDNYITNTIIGDYHFSLYNNCVDQLNGVVSVGTLDGCPKNKSMLFAEAMLYKHRAYKSYRMAYFNVIDLKSLGVTEENLNQYVKDFQQGKIKRTNYDEKDREETKEAKFVNV